MRKLIYCVLNAALVCFVSVCSSSGSEKVVIESARNIPVAYDVDVVVVGGSSGAVAAAVGAAEAGAKVFVAAGRTYLGEDICGTYRLRLEEGEKAKSDLAQKIFHAEGFIKPLHVKRTLDEALLDANVKFLFGCYATDVLVDKAGAPAGIVMANRAGRQVVIAKVIIDATDRAHLARLAGADFKAFPNGPQRFKRIIVGGEPDANLPAKPRKLDFRIKGRDVFEYTLDIDMPDGSFASYAEAEQVARDMTGHYEKINSDASEKLFHVSPDPVKARKSVEGEWPGAGKIAMDVFRPAGVNRLYVLGGCAGMSRRAAAKMLRPVELMATGARVGAAAAKEAKAIAKPEGVRLVGKETDSQISGDIAEVLKGVRPTDSGLATIESRAQAVEVLGEYDVVVIGGGTAGAPAGISAARRGAKTVVVEYLSCLGGVGTEGLINTYWFGNRVGFTKEIDDAVGGPSWNVEKKSQWYRRQLRKAGADIWFGALGCGAFVDNGRVKGVVVATPQGRGVVLAKVVIDSTGNADIAAAAGAECSYTSASHIAIQGAGLPPRQLDPGYVNTDYTFVDDTDVADFWHLFVWARQKFGGAYDLAQILDTRERRRIVGNFVMQPMDIINKRTFADTIVLAKSNFDSHGFTVHPYFLIAPPIHRNELSAYVPYRCLLPRNIEALLVTGLGISAHRDAMPVIRMQADVQNQGYAAGVAAVMAAEQNITPRQVDVKKLQKHLVTKGILDKEVLKHADSYPYSDEQMEDAVRRLLGSSEYDGLSIILSEPEKGLGLLRKAYEAADTLAGGKARCAHVLGIYGDAAGIDTLTAKVEHYCDWDAGWNYTGMGQFGASMSKLDSYIIALGRTRVKKALDPLLKKAALLDAEAEFSHHRAIAMALEAIRDSKAAKPLAQLLKKDGMSGYWVRDMAEARTRYGPDDRETTPRNLALRELVLARALYRCGDYNQVGETILKQYSHDLRGHFARHAKAVLGCE